jgi:hypothetical protein
MDNYLRAPVKVPFSALHLDPNNPRLAPTEPPGYEDPTDLFSPDMQAELSDRAKEAFDLEQLERAVLSQGWMPIDRMVVWHHPDDPDRWVVVEGNRRTATLRGIRTRVAKEKGKLERMNDGRRKFTDADVRDQQEFVAQLERIVADTEMLEVVPLDADTTEELRHKLPRVLAVRHITHARDWGSYAEDIWLRVRYEDLFEQMRPGASKPSWDQAVIELVANEASLSAMVTKRKIRAASLYAHFKSEWEDEFPDGEKLKEPGDYYLFESIIKRPAIRTKFELSDDAMHLPEDSERALFEWVFKLPRPESGKAEDNDNVFYRHENIQVWDQMAKYDSKNKTSFAAQFDPQQPDTATRMIEVEADWLAHKAQRKPADVIDSLLKQLDELKASDLTGQFIGTQLERLQTRSNQLLAMAKAGQSA